MEVRRHIGKAEIGVAIYSDIGRCAVLAHADPPSLSYGVLCHLPRMAPRADHACTMVLYVKVLNAHKRCLEVQCYSLEAAGVILDGIEHKY